MDGPIAPDMFGETPQAHDDGKLREKFMLPPFTVLNAREGWWQERKRAWLALGIKSELGRGEFSQTAGLRQQSYRAGEAIEHNFALSYGTKGWREKHPQKNKFGQKINEEISEKNRSALGVYTAMGGAIDRNSGGQTGTSIFDPVLCELAYRWFCPLGGTIIDPFAGGSVRGIVASKLGFKYIGVDLRDEQVKANQDQGLSICQDPMPVWRGGDSRGIANLCPEKADFIFSCPPYADLEVYSDDPRDLSTLGYNDFIPAYTDIINETMKLLKPNRFACFVVGDVRDKKGNYLGFPYDTIRAFQDIHAPLYNEAVLVTAVGSLPIRINSQFEASRKMGKTHQNVYVFCKGDPRIATGDIKDAAA